jgi:hypothetical protein
LKRTAFTGILILIGINLCLGQQDFRLDFDLQDSWRYQRGKDGAHLPFQKSTVASPKAIHLKLLLEVKNATHLRISIPASSSLFIEGRFIKYFEENHVGLFDADSLSRVLGVLEMHLTLYNKRGFSVPPLAGFGRMQPEAAVPIEVNPVSARSRDDRHNYLKIIILLVFTLFVALFTVVPGEMREFYSIKNLVVFRFTSTYMDTFRTITKQQWMVVIYQSALLAAIMTIALHYYHAPDALRFLVEIDILFGWLLAFAITLIALLLKYILIFIVSSLFDVASSINFYFIEYLRMTTLFYSIVFVILSFTVVNYFFGLQQVIGGLAPVVIGFYLVRFGVIFFKFQRNLPIKNLHLFSYLCSTELIPIIIGLKFFLK